MKIVSINTSARTGGAAIAAYRIAEALNRNSDIEVTLLVQQGNTNSMVVTTTHTRWKRYLNFIRFAYERFLFFLRESSPQVRFLFSIANTGEDISQHPLVQQADIIHLHWVNGGFLSLKDIEKLIRLNKTVVWTLHDMWPFTGGCHHSGSCNNYQHQCGNCMFLKKPHPHDLSYRIWRRKQAFLSHADNLIIVTCSQWLHNCASKSSLFRDKPIYTIPNPIDTRIFTALNKQECREKLGLNPSKKYILFAAHNVNNYFKGFTYFVEAVRIFARDYPQNNDLPEIIIAGKVKDASVFTSLELPYHLLGVVSPDDMPLVYNAADLYVTSSLQENLPNTIMEAMACSVPVVAFAVGGIPDLVDHKHNGWLAHFQSAQSLAEGIRWCLFEANYNQLSVRSREKIVREFDLPVIAEKYRQVFERARNKFF